MTETYESEMLYDQLYSIYMYMRIKDIIRVRQASPQGVWCSICWGARPATWRGMICKAAADSVRGSATAKHCHQVSRH